MDLDCRMQDHLGHLMFTVILSWINFLQWSLKNMIWYQLCSIPQARQALIVVLGKSLAIWVKIIHRFLPVLYSNQFSKQLSGHGVGIIGLSTDAILKLRRSLC